MPFEISFTSYLFALKIHKMSSCDPSGIIPCASSSVSSANQIFLSLIQTLATAQCAISPQDMWPKDFGEEAEKNGMFIENLSK